MAEVIKNLSLNNCYDFFKEKTSIKVSKKQYRDICSDFNKKIIELALTNQTVKLPHNLGIIWIKKCKTNWSELRVDFNATKLQGKTIYHDNTHSDGWWARWSWCKIKCFVPNITYYVFTASRANSRRLAKEMKTQDGHKKYFSQI